MDGEPPETLPSLDRDELMIGIDILIEQSMHCTDPAASQVTSLVAMTLGRAIHDRLEKELFEHVQKFAGIAIEILAARIRSN